MNTTLQPLSERYLAALRTHLAEAADTSMAPAAKLGREALQMNWTPPDLALVHEEALATLMASETAGNGDARRVRRAGCFFRQALAPFAKPAGATHPGKSAAEQAKTHTSAANQDTMKKRLQSEIAKRRAAESALKGERREYARLLAESKIMHKQLRHLSHEILRAQEEERKKISRELHDEISQILTGINVRLAALRIESTANAETISKKIADTQILVGKSVETVHRFARELRPAMLDDLGLIPALTAHLKELRERTGLQLHLKAAKNEAIEAVDSLKRTVLYRIAQEALKNAAKHAQADRVDVSLQVDQDQIRLEVSDNGKSFPVQDVLANKRRNRLGLIGMRERAEMVGGEFSIESAPGKGTTVCAKIPLHSGLGI